MSIRRGVACGFEDGALASTDLLLSISGGDSTFKTGAGVVRENDAKTRGGLRAIQPSSSFSSGNAHFTTPRSDIPWEEFLYDVGIWRPIVAASLSVVFYSTITRVGAATVVDDGVTRLYSGGGTSTATVAGTLQASGSIGDVPTNPSGPDPAPYNFMSGQVLIDASVGLQRMWIDDLATVTLEKTAYNTASGGTDINDFRLISSDDSYFDDFFVRPRCIIVDATGGGTPTSTQITGGTGSETGTIYAWESATSDSATGSGDPWLAQLATVVGATNLYRLYLRELSIAANFTNAPTAGFVDAETITGSGLTGTVTAIVPAANFRAGLEPGGVLLGSRMYIEKQLATGDGNTVAWANSGGGAAWQDVDEVPASDADFQSAASDALKTGVTFAAIKNLGDLDSVEGIIHRIQSSKDGSSPNALIEGIRDNVVERVAETRVLPDTSEPSSQAYYVDSNGAQFTNTSGQEVVLESDTV